MLWIRSALRRDTDTRDILHSNARNLMYTMLGLYLVWHSLATLVWPDMYSPRIWITTLAMLVLVITALRLLEDHYLVAQALWLGGLLVLVLNAYRTFGQHEIALLLAFLPLVAIISVGVPGTLLVELGLMGGLVLLPALGWIPPLPTGYAVAVVLGSLFSGFFGWGVTRNLTSALVSASYHYRQARELLDETRSHRAEISRMLKDQSQTNYQLERLNTMLHEARRRAEEARDDRDRFVMAVSHELRNPLNLILGFSDLMVNSPDTYAPPDEWPQGLYEDALEVYRSSTHLMGLINDILDLGKIDAHQMTVFRERADLAQVIQEVAQMAGSAFRQKELWLRLELDPDLPQVFVDTTRLRQVLLNLLNNSLRFTEQGGVTIRAELDNGSLQVRVEDTGSGIAPADLPKVFDEFRQVGQDSWRRREGAGLGLAISRRFIELMGGEMWVESELGRGSCFFFNLPLETTEKPLLSAEPEAGSIVEYREEGERRWLSPWLRSRPLVVLLAGSDRAGKVLGYLLGDYQIAVAHHADQVPLMVSQLMPRAVVVDLDGADPHALALNRLPYDLPVLGAHLPASIDQPESLPEGVARYLVKPIARPDLIGALAEHAPAARRVLVVDDDPALVRFVTQALKTAVPDQGLHPELEVLMAYSGEEALDLLRAGGVEALLLDLDLPDISGWQVMAQAQAEARLAGIPVIIISAADPPRAVQQPGARLLEVYLNRSFTQGELAAALKSLLANLQPVYPQPAALTDAG